MITPITSIARLAWRSRAIAVPLLVVGALAAGCGTTHSGPVAGGSPSAPSASATPVPTVTGGRVTPGEPACVGWPASTSTAPLPVSFVPVSVERCVDASQAIPGKGQWVTATLERANTGLAGLINALRHPTATRTPGIACPALAILPPQVVLISGNGKTLIPRLPVSGCGLIQSEVLAQLNALSWHPVSVRLVAQVPGTATPGAPGNPGTPVPATPAPATSRASGGGMQPQ